MSSASVARAKKFLVGRVLDQAKRDEVTLTEVEIRMLGFAELSAGAKDMEAAAVFEREYNDKEYEAKVAELLRRAYTRDKERDGAAAWDEALADLAEEDMYLLVMLARAGIEASNPFSHMLDWRFFLANLPICIAVTAGIVLAFTPFGARLVPNDFLRLVLLLLLLVAPLLIDKIGHKPTA
jgi:hypothetical protein